MPSHYFAFGLRIESDITFPELMVIEDETESIPDLVISLRTLTSAEHETPLDQYYFVGHLNNDLMRFLIASGSRMVIDIAPEVDIDTLRPCILGPLFAILLRQRGLLVLHASCVVVGQQAIGFLGHSGAGKSTLATEFYRRNSGVLTDDVMGIEWQNFAGAEVPMVMPSYPNVRLLPDAADSLGYDFATLDFIHAGSPKRNQPVAATFPSHPYPLACLYVISDHDDQHHGITVLTPQAAFVELMRHSRVTHLMTHPTLIQQHLTQCTQLISQLPMCRLARNRSLAALPELVTWLQKMTVQPLPLSVAAR